ncbi:MAG: cupredoxin domain-containing protein [Nitrosopumilus sp.]
MKKKGSKTLRTKIISTGVVAGVIILIGIIGLNSFNPVNSDNFVFAPTTNVFLKAVKSVQGYHYSLQSTKGGKRVPTTLGTSPDITVSKGNLIEIHFINEEKNEHGEYSTHNLNIDEFNVHTKDLGYFQTETITFLADKVGTFDYYCTIHEDMKGVLTVTE